MQQLNPPRSTRHTHTHTHPHKSTACIDRPLRYKSVRTKKKNHWWADNSFTNWLTEEGWCCVSVCVCVCALWLIWTKTVWTWLITQWSTAASTAERSVLSWSHRSTSAETTTRLEVWMTSVQIFLGSSMSVCESYVSFRRTWFVFLFEGLHCQMYKRSGRRKKSASTLVNTSDLKN